MNYVIIENKKEKLYDIEECSEPMYWFDKNEKIKEVLQDYTYDVYLLDYQSEENERLKENFLKSFSENKYKKAFLTQKLIMLGSQADDKIKINKKRR